MRCRDRCVRGVTVAWLALCVVACATTQGKFRGLGSAYPAHPPTFPVEVFESDPPTRPFERIARLDAHFEQTGFMSTSHQTGIEELKKQARAAGADAIIEVRELHSHVGETLILHVTATGIRYTSAPLGWSASSNIAPADRRKRRRACCHPGRGRTPHRNRGRSGAAGREHPRSCRRWRVPRHGNPRPAAACAP